MSILAKTLLRLAVSVALLWFVLRSVDLAALWSRVRGMQPGWLAMAVATYVFTLIVGVWRWDRLLQAQHIEVRPRRLHESMWVSQFFNNFLPSNIGGDVIRIADTAPAAGSKTVATTVVIADRALGLVAVLLVATVATLAAAAVGIHIPGARWLWLGSAGMTIAAAPVIAWPRLIEHALAPIRRLNRPWIAERAVRLEEALLKFRAAPGALLFAFIGAIVVQVSLVAFYLLAARSLAVPLPILLGAVLIPVSFVIQMAPVSVNGFGLREAVFVFFFARFGLPTDGAVALSLVATGLVMAISLGGGLVFLTRGRAAAPAA